MSVADPEATDGSKTALKRKAEAAEIEIDVNAPEPPSKKALRKAKRAKVSTDNNSESTEKEKKDSLSQKPEPSEDRKRSQYGIWIGNLSFGTTKDDLMTFLSTRPTIPIQRDHITRIHLPQGPPKFGKPTNKGFAYIDFVDEDSLNQALELTEAVLGGRRVLIKNAKNFEGRPEQKKDKDEKETQAPSKRIFIGNLDFDTTVEDLEEHFAVCGSILHTHMATFEDTGKCKGYAWIEFEQLASAEAAMRGWVENQNADEESSAIPRKHRVWLQKIHGRKLRMEYAEDKATRYQKRFGKNAKSGVSQGRDENGEIEDESQDPIVEVEENRESAPVPRKNKTTKSKPQGKYSDATVQRLTGAIIESKGQRKVFE